MILQELCKYYDRLRSDPNVEIAPPGFVVQGVAFEVLISQKGELLAINDLRENDGGTKRPRKKILPGNTKPSGSGINPLLYGWDRTDYMLGYLDPESLKASERDKKMDRCRKAHHAYKETMLEREKSVNDPEFSAFCRFLETWDPERVAEFAWMKEVSGLFGVVRVGAESKRFLHENPAVYNDVYADATDAEPDRCAATGELGEIAKTHSVKIKGVNGAQSSGAALVSFNDPAYESYGFKQSYNACVIEDTAFKYTTALNKLLERNGSHRLQLGDTTVVFWSEQPTEAENIFGWCFNEENAEDHARTEEIRTAFSRMRKGQAEIPDSGVKFFVLGLAPNSSRLAVRFWLVDTVGQMMQRVIDHQNRLEIARGPKDRDHLGVGLLLAQTAAKTEDIPPLLGGALARAILSGSRYPDMLLQSVIRRIRVEREIHHPKAAILKAVLSQNYNKEISVSLNPNRPEPAYQLGRLFAVLERTQEAALGNLNATIKDRYFSAASATPAAVFPRLIRSSQHHLGKLEGGMKVWAEKRIQDVCANLETFPSHLGLPDQGLFALGYYHQRQQDFTKKDQPTETPA